MSKNIKLSGAMWAELEKNYWKTPTVFVTIEALYRRGLIDSKCYNWNLTILGEDVLDFEKKLKNANCYKDDHNIIFCEEKLKKMCEQEGVDVYIYRASYPWVVKNGNGQKPLGVLHPKLFWQLRAGKIDGFKRYSIGGHKGSYGFELLKKRIKKNASS